MSTSAFTQQAIVEIDGKPYQLKRKFENDVWQLEDCRTGRLSERTQDELHLLFAQTKLKFPSRSVAVGGEGATGKVLAVADSPQLWEDAKVRLAYVKAAEGIPSSRARLNPVIQEVWQRIQAPARMPNAATVMDWKRKYLCAGRGIRVLIENRSAKGNRKPRFPQEVQEFVERAINEKFLKLERGTMKDTLSHAQFLTIQANKLRPQKDQLRLPTRRLVERTIQSKNAFDRCAARYGWVEARKRFRSVTSHKLTNAPLERAEIDHTLVNVLVVDDQTGLPLGRPWITACIDCHTRNVLGIYISFTPPSYFTVARCLRQAVMPKIALLKQHPGIKRPWNAHGIMGALVVDNGTEFHSVDLENLCLSLGIEILYAPRKTPWCKGQIERFLKTINEGVTNNVPGKTFANILERNDYDPTKHAVVSYSVFKEVVYRWIVDVYHQEPHSALGMPPAVMWANSIAPEDILVPDDPVLLDAILGKRVPGGRQLTHKGIELHGGLFYNSRELGKLRDELGDKLNVEVCVDEADLGQVVVFSPDKRRMFTVPALRADYARGLSSYQHAIIKRYAAEQLKQYSPEGWLEAKAAIAELINGEILKNKRRTHAKIARYLEDGTTEKTHQKGKTPAKPPAQAPEPVEVIDAPPIEPVATVLPTPSPSRVSKAGPVASAGPQPAADRTARRKTFTPVLRDRASRSDAFEINS